MICYSCGAKLSEHSFCTNCGADVSLYKKIIRTSNYFYNKGLEKAKVRDLSGAIVSLRQSLKFNKNNIKARNLLGLVYFETGEVAAALSEWVISKNLRAKKNIAVDYIEMVQSNTGKLDSLNQAAKKYNTALEYCQKEDGVDMAIIQLKKVIGLNPRFVRAHQLLALCYLKSGRAELAKRELDKARAIDVNNTLTLQYLKEADSILNPTEDSSKKKDKPREEAVTYIHDNETIIQPAAIKEHKGTTAVLNIILGIAIGLAIAFFLIIPAKVQEERAAARESVKNFGTELDAKNITINELNKSVSDLNSKISSLSDELETYKGMEGKVRDMDDLIKAASIYVTDSTKFLETADYITAIKPDAWGTDTSENYKNLYYALKASIGPSVCDAYYAEGYKAYRAKEYDDAIAYLEAAVFFDAADVDAIYQLAVTYQSAERNEDARKAYTKVVDNFPGTWHAGKAEAALKKLDQ